MKRKKLIAFILSAILTYSPSIIGKSNYLVTESDPFDLETNDRMNNIIEDYKIKYGLTDEEIKEIISIENFDNCLYQRLNDIVYEYNEEQKRIKEEEERLAYEKMLSEKFPKYNLTESELEGLARLCYQEQGTLKGIAAEASLMANKCEISGRTDLYNYVRNCGWFENSTYFMDSGYASKEAIEVVRLVLVEGMRTLPPYINEHVGMYAVDYVTNNDGSININDHEDYIKGETKIHQGSSVGGGSFTYYCFPDENSDVFGTTVPDVNPEEDICYDVDKVLEKVAYK